VNVISSGNKDLISALSNLKDLSANNQIKHIPGKQQKSIGKSLLTVFEIAAYAVIISYGIHSMLVYYNYMK
jgi:hypothetical protein